MLATSPAFKENAARALADTGLQKALARTRPQSSAKRSAAVAALPEFEQLRDIGRDIKNHALANLDFYLETWSANVERAGGHVHWCSTPDDARAAVLKICRDAGARTVTKGKSMISEELGINEHLERHGIEPIETDSRRIHPPAPPGAPEPHHRARLPPQPRGLGGEFPQIPHRPARRPRVSRAARHHDRGTHPAAPKIPSRRRRHYRRQFPDRRDRQQRHCHQ